MRPKMISSPAPEETLPSWEVYEQLEGESEIPTKGKMSLLMSKHLKLVQEHLDEEEIAEYKKAIRQISEMSEEEFQTFVLDTLKLYKDYPL